MGTQNRPSLLQRRSRWFMPATYQFLPSICNMMRATHFLSKCDDVSHHSQAQLAYKQPLGQEALKQYSRLGLQQMQNKREGTVTLSAAKTQVPLATDTHMCEVPSIYNIASASHFQENKKKNPLPFQLLIFNQQFTRRKERIQPFTANLKLSCDARLFGSRAHTQNRWERQKASLRL